VGASLFIYLNLLFSSLSELKQEAQLRGWDASTWTQNQCEELIIRIPSSSGSVENAVLLHSVSEDEFVVARMHWEAIKQIQNRARDLYLVVTCGGSSTATFVHSFLRKLEGFIEDLTTTEKLEFAKLGQDFPNLTKVKFVWNQGAEFDSEILKPWILAPIGISQPGFWSGRLKLKAQSWVELQAKYLDLQNYFDEISQPKRFSMKTLHFEQAEWVSRLSKTQDWWNRILDFLSPRGIYFRNGWERKLAQEWEMSEPEATKIETEGIFIVSHRFIGGRLQNEIEETLRDQLEKSLLKGFKFNIETVHFSPFIRSVYEGKEARAFDRILRSKPQVIPVPVISDEQSESALFRQAGISTYDLSLPNNEIDRELLFEILK